MSPMTGPMGDLGDTYSAEIGRVVVDFDNEVFGLTLEAYHALFGSA